MESSETQPPVLVLVRDLIFATKIRGTAEALGTPVKMLRDPATLAQHEGKLLIVDLNLPGVIPAAAQWQSHGDRRVVGFVSHVDAETIAAARAAGITQVLPRSKFVELLPSLFGG
jgi:DNA-binding NarL/FixJ family response regulator